MSKKGYIPGTGSTFTPSNNAQWTDQFEQLLEDKKVSRNKLTEQLISDGLKMQNSEFIMIPVNNLTAEQLMLLNSEQGKQILVNIALMMVGQSQQPIAFSQVMNATTSSNVEAAATIQSKEEITQLTENELVIEKIDVQPEVVSPIKEETQPTPTEKPTGLARLKQQMGQMKLKDE